MKASRNFDMEEFSCHCGCGLNLTHPYLVSVLQDLRDHFGEPVKITSSTRCPEHNMNIGGAPQSKHLLGIAADIQVTNTPPSVVHTYLETTYPNAFGLGLYPSFVHLDVRPERARWGDIGLT